MDELFANIISEIEKYLLNKNFVLKGKSTFVNKESQLKKENNIILYYRKSRSPYDYIEITAICNIYYKSVNMLDKKIINDSINSYPIIAGSIGYFKENNKEYFKINIKEFSEVNVVSEEIIKNIEEGAFNLFSSFSTLENILKAIENKHVLFGISDYINPNLRFSIRRACIICLLYGKEEAIKWFDNFAPNEKNKREFINKMICEW
jgi:hypothetical protein